ncbi:amidohydrolase family protein [Actinomadura luteofluorescens]|uniref:N-acyl-D-amino-acid deacylase family protein n=1 Tax=Actinomadura luteofluorescens TaxID=46163 RepID=UPI0021648013|nr:amidohydrolase family protein [Actinomadura glauciflava]MCR3739539.1 N-acyl-D-amino-acid deacylase [Actinomadura glauciflava]
MYDLLVRGGTVLDGTGAPGRRADVAVTAGRIAAVGALDGARASSVIDATGRYVMPGFIDTHVHGDAAVFDPDVQLAALRQGVTTFVLGQDGVSYAPAGAETLRYVSRYFAPVNGPHPGLDGGPVTVAELLAGYDRRTPLNTVYLLPHGTIRHGVMGTARRAPEPGELAAMRAHVERGLSEGAAGLSTGLEYVPGAYAGAAEIAALCAPVGAAGLPYVTHMRGYESAAGAAMAEVLEIARAGRVAPHVSHYHGPGDELVALVDGARAEGIDLTFDNYPYLRGSSTLTLVTLPDWLPIADLDATLDALADPSVRDRLERDWFAHRPEVWPRITLSHVPADEFRWAEGMSLPDAAERAGSGPGAFCCDLLVATRLEAGCVFGQPPTNSEESVRALLRHPAQTTGSDAIYQGGHPHPRGWGAFARLLGRHVRELGDWTWEQAAVHLAGRAADRFRLADRGRVETGRAADLAVVDPAAVTDRATYERPRVPADGVEHVVVNGVPVLSGGDLAEYATPPGRALRPA